MPSLHASTLNSPATKQCAFCNEVMVRDARYSFAKYCNERCKYGARVASHPRCSCGNPKHHQAASCRTCARFTRYAGPREVAIQTREQRINHKIQSMLNAPALKPTMRIFKSGLCKVCGEGYVSLNGDATCSDQCQARHATEIKNDGKQRRRARERQAFVSRVSRISIYERDNWTCMLCNLPIDKQAKSPAPWSASIDHVIPLSKGGTHEPSNVQAAHSLCNSIKGDREYVSTYPGVPLLKV